jgi:serine/threonine protein kinase
MKKGQPPLEEIVYLMRQISGGLDYAHRQGIIHRDVKPSNIMIDPEGNSFVTDFGIARMAAGFGDDMNRLTQTGAAIGTPDYMSPEQGMGREKVDQRADIYSLGVMLFEMLSGELPFIADTAMEVIFRHTRDPVPSVLSVKNDLPPDVDKVLQKAMAKEPEERFESCSEFSSAVTDSLGGKVAHRPSIIQAAAQESQLLIVQKRDRHAEEINQTIADFKAARGESSIGSSASTPAEHNQRVTAVYINAAEFTEIVDEIEGAEAARAATGSFWKNVLKSVTERKGRVFSQGEGSMLALWGAEGASEDDPEMAVRTALAAQSELRRLSKPYLADEDEDEPLPLKIRYKHRLNIAITKRWLH